MAEKTTPKAADRRLADLIRKVKAEIAERDDVVVDMKESAGARLEILADELQPLVDDVPRDLDGFDFALSSGEPPRLWIDAVAHVHMGRDRRTYRFVRDTRLGRVVIEEASDVSRAADAISRYVAERMIERQRFLDGDMDDLRAIYARRGAQPPKAAPPGAEPVPTAGADTPRPANVFVIGLLWFILGCVAGAGVLIAAFGDHLSGAVN